jgi:hypothetical protein
MCSCLCRCEWLGPNADGVGLEVLLTSFAMGSLRGCGFDDAWEKLRLLKVTQKESFDEGPRENLLQPQF